MTTLKFKDLAARKSFRQQVVDTITLAEVPPKGCVAVGYFMCGYPMEARKAPAKDKWELFVDGEFFTDFLWK